MIRINLLAAERPAQKAKAAPGAMQAYVIIGLFAGGALATCLVLYWMKANQLAEIDNRIKQEQAENARLQEVKKRVDDLTAKEANLKQKMKVLEELKASKGTSVRMLDEISKALPDYLWLASMDQTGTKLTFQGQAAGMTSVADFMKAMNASTHPNATCEPGSADQAKRAGCWFPVVDLVSMTEANNVITFSLAATFQVPKPPAPPEEAAAPGPKPPGQKS